jgi:hypothetical protein
MCKKADKQKCSGKLRGFVCKLLGFCIRVKMRGKLNSEVTHVFKTRPYGAAALDLILLC